MVIVVTGGIGSGKSAVCRILEEKYGCAVYYADAEAKRLYREYPEMILRMEWQLGVSLRNDDGNFVPGLLAERIFGDENAIEIVESILFPYMLDDFKAFVRENDGNVVFESATVLEKPQFDGIADKIILVDAPKELRLSRACERDDVSEEKILQRMERQKMMNDPDKAVLPAGTEILKNVGTLHDLEKSLDLLMKRMLQDNKINN